VVVWVRVCLTALTARLGGDDRRNGSNDHRRVHRYRAAATARIVAVGDADATRVASGDRPTRTDGDVKPP
jgi:hypothetical protein